MYERVISALIEASKALLDKLKNGHKQVLGWNDYCKAAHSDAREAYLLWRDNHKPRQGHLFEQMKRTRGYFKYVMKKCARDSNIIMSDNLAK